MQKFVNGDMVLFENGTIGMYREDSTGKYFTFGTLEEGYKPEYHNNMITGLIHENKYHFYSHAERVKLTVEGIISNVKYVQDYTHDSELMDRLQQIIDDSNKINDILDSGAKY